MIDYIDPATKSKPKPILNFYTTYALYYHVAIEYARHIKWLF